jgi:predicted nucleic acid-binding protein
VILIDSNVPMYIVGEPHPNKATALRLVERCLGRGERLVTDAEVLQEILHRYSAIRRKDAIQPCFDALLGMVDDVLPIERDDALRAREILLGSAVLSARDAIHVAVMERGGIDTVLSFDAGFDGVAGISRLRE